MNAQATISMVVMIFQFFGIGVAGIAEVFVGQYYGAKKYEQLAKPVWQMIWFSIVLIIPFSIIGFTLDDIMVSKIYGQDGRSFFRFLMCIIFLAPLNSALSAFYIGRGKTKLITLSSVFTNVLNIVLAYFFVFGIEGYLPKLGLMGSAYALAIAIFVQTIILAIGFFSKANIERFATLNLKIDSKEFYSCFKVGIPNALSHLIEIAGWAVMNRYLAELGKDFITVSTLAQNFFFLVVFVTDGIQKAVIAIASNAIGARRSGTIYNTLYSAIKVQLMVSGLFLFPFIIFPEPTLLLFIHSPEEMHIMKIALGALIGAWVYCLIDGMVWIIAGILTSGGDTKFIMIMNTLASWLLGVVPIVLLVNKDTNPAFSWMFILPFYAFCNLLGLLWRFKAGKWKTALVD
jgi:MATE family multidrug resistance protein